MKTHEQIAEAIFDKLTAEYRLARSKDFPYTMDTPAPVWKKKVKKSDLREKHETKAYRAMAKWLVSIGVKWPNNKLANRPPK